MPKIKKIFEESRQEYGSRRVQKALESEGFEISRRRVVNLMNKLSLRPKARRKFKATTKQSQRPHYVAPNLLQQNFVTMQPNQAWVTDITYSAPRHRSHTKWSLECEQGWNVSNSDMEVKDEIPAIGYTIARVETAVTCSVLAG